MSKRPYYYPHRVRRDDVRATRPAHRTIRQTPNYWSQSRNRDDRPSTHTVQSKTCILEPWGGPTVMDHRGIMPACRLRGPRRTQHRHRHDRTNPDGNHASNFSRIGAQCSCKTDRANNSGPIIRAPERQYRRHRPPCRFAEGDIAPLPPVGRMKEKSTGVGDATTAVRHDHRMPESFRAFCRIVSLTAAKTSRMLVVSVAWVKLWCG